MFSFILFIVIYVNYHYFQSSMAHWDEYQITAHKYSVYRCLTMRNGVECTWKMVLSKKWVAITFVRSLFETFGVRPQPVPDWNIRYRESLLLLPHPGPRLRAGCSRAGLRCSPTPPHVFTFPSADVRPRGKPWLGAFTASAGLGTSFHAELC